MQQLTLSEHKQGIKVACGLEILGTVDATRANDRKGQFVLGSGSMQIQVQVMQLLRRFANTDNKN